MRINSHLLSTVEIPSNSLGVLGSIVHPINRGAVQDPGYTGVTEGKIYQENALIATFEVNSADATQGMQVMIDLSRSKGTRKKYPVSSRGYLTFFVSQGPGKYHVTLEQLAPNRNSPDVSPLYDTSKQLEPGDFFTVSLVKPGTYSVDNILPTPPISSEITLAPASPTKTPHSPPKPVIAECTKNDFSYTLDGQKFNPKKDHLVTNQGLLFQIKNDPAVIVLRLQEQDNSSSTRPLNRSARWLNPSRIGEEGQKRACQPDKE